MKNYKEYDKESIRAAIECGLKRDLHMHTCYSDGSLTPEEVIDLRVSKGFECLAITDHDGMEASAMGMEYAEKLGISFISGIELDSNDEVGRDLHMLGYGFDYNNPDFRRDLLDIRVKRAQRNDRLMKALNDHGYNITLEDVGAINDGRYVGKPTFAQILVQKGVANTPDQIFKGVFREDDIRAIKKETISSKKAIDIIHEAGGVAILAHPMEQRHMEESFKDFLPRMYKILDKMREYGVDGIECTHPSASHRQKEILMEYADFHGLIISEGSDLHNPLVPRNYARYHRP